jgi:hypothetical protein
LPPQESNFDSPTVQPITTPADLLEVKRGVTIVWDVISRNVIGDVLTFLRDLLLELSVLNKDEADASERV